MRSTASAGISALARTGGFLLCAAGILPEKHGGAVSQGGTLRRSGGTGGRRTARTGGVGRLQARTGCRQVDAGGHSAGGAVSHPEQDEPSSGQFTRQENIPRRIGENPSSARNMAKVPAIGGTCAAENPSVPNRNHRRDPARAGRYHAFLLPLCELQRRRCGPLVSAPSASRRMQGCECTLIRMGPEGSADASAERHGGGGSLEASHGAAGALPRGAEQNPAVLQGSRICIRVA